MSAAVSPSAPLLYKVVELSTVDERSLESAVNEWVQQGWTLENVQFAMRDSSKRPAMAFVFFTRESSAGLDAGPDPDAEQRLRRLADSGASRPSPRERLAQLAGLERS